MIYNVYMQTHPPTHTHTQIVKLLGALCPLEPRLGKKLVEPVFFFLTPRGAGVFFLPLVEPVYSFFDSSSLAKKIVGPVYTCVFKYIYMDTHTHTHTHKHTHS
jgi:hypothetical protein